MYQGNRNRCFLGHVERVPLPLPLPSQKGLARLEKLGEAPRPETGRGQPVTYCLSGQDRLKPLAGQAWAGVLHGAWHRQPRRGKQGPGRLLNLSTEMTGAADLRTPSQSSPPTSGATHALSQKGTDTITSICRPVFPIGVKKKKKKALIVP